MIRKSMCLRHFWRKCRQVPVLVHPGMSPTEIQSSQVWMLASFRSFRWDTADFLHQISSDFFHHIGLVKLQPPLGWSVVLAGNRIAKTGEAAHLAMWRRESTPKNCDGNFELLVKVKQSQLFHLQGIHSSLCSLCSFYFLVFCHLIFVKDLKKKERISSTPQGNTRDKVQGNSTPQLWF